MMSNVFFDTNILLYGSDNRFPAKRDVALMLLEHAGQEQRGAVSTQVLQEFYVAATRKLNLDPVEAKEIVQYFSDWRLARISPEDIQQAINGNMLWQISFWDALIVVAAAKLKCALLYTEDLHHGQIISGVQIVNPFHETV